MYLSVNRRAQFTWGAKDASGYNYLHTIYLENKQFLYREGNNFFRDLAIKAPIDISMEGVVEIRKYNGNVNFFLNNNLLSICDYVVNHG